jgi:thioredoxin reductase
MMYLIIGSGVAGLTTAIKLAEAGKNVAIDYSPIQNHAIPILIGHKADHLL